MLGGLERLGRLAVNIVADFAIEAPADPESSNDPKNRSPGTPRSLVATSAKMILSPAATMIPKRMARLRSSGDSEAAAMPMIRALSPDRTRSASTIAPKSKSCCSISGSPPAVW
jgi:hypothetical protein